IRRRASGFGRRSMKPAMPHMDKLPGPYHARSALSARRRPLDPPLPFGYKRAVSDRAPQVSIVIPCYNEEQTIPRLCAARDDAVAKLEAADRPRGVLVVDDGSTDDSFARLKAPAATRPWLRLV